MKFLHNAAFLALGIYVGLMICMLAWFAYWIARADWTDQSPSVGQILDGTSTQQP